MIMTGPLLLVAVYWTTTTTKILSYQKSSVHAFRVASSLSTRVARSITTSTVPPTTTTTTRRTAVTSSTTLLSQYQRCLEGSSSEKFCSRTVVPTFGSGSSFVVRKPYSRTTIPNPFLLQSRKSSSSYNYHTSSSTLLQLSSNSNSNSDSIRTSNSNSKNTRPLKCNVSRITTLQTILCQYGVPGSTGCQKTTTMEDGKVNDLQPIDLSNVYVSVPYSSSDESSSTSSFLHHSSTSSFEAVPELLSSLQDTVTMKTIQVSTPSGSGSDSTDSGLYPDWIRDLHPYLYPIVYSKSTDHVICAYGNPGTFLNENDDTTKSNKNQQQPWPIVETKIGSPGFRILALNSEHLMRRIICECDFTNHNNNNNNEEDEKSNNNSSLIDLYNEGLGTGTLSSSSLDKTLDVPYIRGSVKQLGYGVDKYVLLRVGPFPDIYETLVNQHWNSNKQDEQSALITAESCNSKFPGYASSVLQYTKLLQQLPYRSEECRDAARMCLRCPLATIGIDTYKDLKIMAQLGQMMKKTKKEDANDTNDANNDNNNNNSDEITDTLRSIQEFMNLMESVEKDDDTSKSAAQTASSGKTQHQIILDEGNKMINQALLQQKSYNIVRYELEQHYRKANLHELANYVSYCCTYQR